MIIQFLSHRNMHYNKLQLYYLLLFTTTMLLTENYVSENWIFRV